MLPAIWWFARSQPNIVFSNSFSLSCRFAAAALTPAGHGEGRARRFGSDMVDFGLCLLVAVFLGAWRAAHRHPERPLKTLAWSNSIVRWGSFLTVAAASVWAAKILTALTAKAFGETVGLFSFGVWLAMR